MRLHLEKKQNMNIQYTQFDDSHDYLLPRVPRVSRGSYVQYTIFTERYVADIVPNLTAIYLPPSDPIAGILLLGTRAGGNHLLDREDPVGTSSAPL